MRTAYLKTGALTSTPHMSSWFPRILRRHPKSQRCCLVLRHHSQTNFDQDKINMLGLQFWKWPLWRLCLLKQGGRHRLFQLKPFCSVWFIRVSSRYAGRKTLREAPFPSWVPALLQGQMAMAENFIVTTAVINGNCAVLPHVRALHGGGENLPSEHPWEAALSRRQDVAWQRQTPTDGEAEMACPRAEGVHRGSFGGSLKTTRPYKAMDLPRKGSADGLIRESSLPLIPVV